MTHPSSEEVICAVCGNANRRDARFCRRCGATLPTLSQDPPPEDVPATPGAVPPTAPVPAAPVPAGPQASPTMPPEPARSRGFPWVLVFVLGIAALFLVGACVGAGLYFVTASRSEAVAPTPVEAVVPVEPTARASARPTPTAAPTDAAAEPTAEPADEEPGASASATALAESVAERQTALAAALATPELPTPEPVVELAPEPGTLGLPDYERAVGGYGQRLFETFDRGETTKAIWSQFDNENVGARLRNNFYALTLKGPDKNMWETWDRDLGSTYNVELSVAFETTGVPASVGIAFDIQPDSDNGVFFEVFNDKHWQLRTVQDGRLVRERTTGRIPLPELQDGVGTNVLWVVRTPEQVQLWINSKHVATVPAGPFAGGQAGVIASSRSELSGQATVIVDNFRVRTP